MTILHGKRLGEISVLVLLLLLAVHSAHAQIDVIRMNGNGVTGTHTFAAPFTFSCGTNITCTISGTTVTLSASLTGGAVSTTGTPQQYQIPYWNNATTIGGIAWLTGYDGVSQGLCETTSGGAATLPVGCVPNIVPTTVSANSTLTVANRDILLQLTAGGLTLTDPGISTTGFGTGYDFHAINDQATASTFQAAAGDTITFNGTKGTAGGTLSLPSHTLTTCTADTTTDWLCWQGPSNGAVSGSGTVTTTGSPASGQLSAFSGATSITTATGHEVVAPLDCFDTSGSATAQSCSTAPTFTPVKGDAIVYSTTTANTGALTLNVNGAGAAAVQKWEGTALAAGDMAANKPVVLTYDGTNWQAQTIGNAPSGSGGSTLWSGIGNPTANLALTMGTNTSTFNYGSPLAAAFTWANPTAATSTTSQSSPVLQLCGQGWEGSTPANTTDCFTLQDAIPNGANTIPTLTFGHSGATTNVIAYNFSGGSASEASLGSGRSIDLVAGAANGSGGDVVDLKSGSNGSISVFSGVADSVNNVTETFGNPFNAASVTANLAVSTAGDASSFSNSTFKATAALTAGEVVKLDTANANSVVVAGTSDGTGVDFSFVTNSPGAGALASIAMPGSVITTPKLGTGTCAIGNFVVADTTTAGDIKCTATYTAGTILGYAMTAQSTVGGTVTVYVQPR